MLDLNLIAENADAVVANNRRRGVDVDLPRLLLLRDKRSELIQRTETLKHEQKETGAGIPKASPEERQTLIARTGELKKEVAAAAEELTAVEEELREIQALIPNLTHPDAPDGGEHDGRMLREEGEKPNFEFEPLDHVELCEKHGLVDFASAAKTTGAGFYFLAREAVLLELALVRYAIEKATAAGFIPHTTPDLAREEVLRGTGFNPRGEETQIYSVEGTDLSLIATAEITLGGMRAGTTFEPNELPLKLAGVSHCYRTEAGAYGKATRGLYRVHQFTKVELFAFTAADLGASGRMHGEILALEEEIFTGLGIPYRVLDIAAGDLGGPAYRKFDLEAWMPGRDNGSGQKGSWGEVTSCSDCTDYQARRLDVRVKRTDEEGKPAKGTDLVHTLNGTAIAVSRALIALLENNQREDGSIGIPEVLQPYCGFDSIG
ncbi:serine--tRNA ligase [Alienimonas chondri]|uniref:Serine--tRNA ligase n=1 Tax=Alienimonas chondri TaxID=2681879 RepID=A0ABX1VBJ6_9PLAN|nr:serine--tRNA ligase [Alienimonas chondri]NNJ25316.1 Serine--tRNA ligase [Alienimonas chondri]